MPQPYISSFLTGSRVYGIPREDSDIDLVILIKREDLVKLVEMADKEKTDNSGYDPEDAKCLRFGKLNLLCCCNPKHFAVWRQATKDLIGMAPVTKDMAVSHLHFLRVREGIQTY